MGRYSLEELEQRGRDLHQPFAAERANVHEWAEREAKAAQELADAGTALAVAEGQLEAAKGTDAKAARATFAKAAERIGEAKKAHATAEQFLVWTREQRFTAEARVKALEEQAADYIGREVVRPLHEAAVTRIDNALEELLAAFAEEHRVREALRSALKKSTAEEPDPSRRHNTPERAARYIRALGSLEAVGNYGSLVHAANCWRKDAGARGAYKVRPHRGV